MYRVFTPSLWEGDLKVFTNYSLWDGPELLSSNNQRCSLPLSIYPVEIASFDQ